MDNSKNQLTIEQVNYYQKSGGAARIAWLLHQTYIQQKMNSYMGVAIKETNDPLVFQIPNDEMRSVFEKWIGGILKNLQSKTKRNLSLEKNLFRLANLQNVISEYLGLQTSNFPGTKVLLDIPPQRPNILHLHNLHINYFDLNQIPKLSQQLPIVCTLHDEWLMTGHCAYSLECQRWKDGCGNCPDLNRYPTVRKDRTHINWKRKQKIFRKSHLYLAAPSQYVIDYALESILSPAIRKTRVIHNGVDLNIFKPADKNEIRENLAIPQDAFVLLYIVAGKMKYHPYKDFTTVENALSLIQKKIKNRKIVFIGLGGEEKVDISGEIEMHFVPYQSRQEDVAAYYQAADVYLHAAKAETFSNVILESRACGTPVITTAIGGILDQIRHEQNGFLVNAGDSSSMADYVFRLMNDKELWNRISKNGIEDARKNFSLEKMVDEYLLFYKEALDDWHGKFEN